MKNALLLPIFAAVLSSSVSAFAVSKQCHFVSGADAVAGKTIRVLVTDQAFEIVLAQKGYEQVVTSYQGDKSNGPKRSNLVFAGPDLEGNDGLIIRMDRSLLAAGTEGSIQIRLDNTSEGYVDTTYFCRD